MHRHASVRSALLVLLSLVLTTSAWATPNPDSLLALSAHPAARAVAVSGPPPPPPPPPPPTSLGGGRVLFAPGGEGPNDQLGNSVASAGDVNGDGYPDVIAGAWSSDATAGDAGSAYIYFGGPAADGVPDVILRGQGFSDNFGTSVASAGDMNGDGFADVIVGAWMSPYSGARTGRAYVYFGGPSPDSVPDLVLAGQSFDDHFGVSVSSAGDLNGDGFSDVIVGASENDATGSGAGRAYVYFGGATPNATADLILSGAAPGDHFGYSVASLRDFNGDGFPDVAVGAYGSGGTGRAYVFYGGPGLDALPDLTLNGELPNDFFGVTVSSVGDVSGDGYEDLAVAAHMNDAGGANAGRVYLYRGGPGADANPDLVLTGAAAGDAFGQSIAGAGDMNGDGYGDLMIGAWLNDANGTNAGRAYLYFGGPAIDAVPDVTLSGEAAGDRLGVSAAGVGDFNQDGSADVIAGAYFNDFGFVDGGRAYVVTLAGLRPPVVTAPATLSGSAGSSISFSVTASDPDGDAIVSLVAAPLPEGAMFTPNATKSSGVFEWTPGPSQVGDYAVVFTASNDQTGNATTHISVAAAANRAPVLDPVSNMTVNEGATEDQAIHGTDPDGDPLTFSLAAGPSFVSVTTVDPTSGDLHLAPGFSDAGTYAATVRADDGRGGTATAAVSVSVVGVNRAPVLAGPAGVFGAEGVSISVLITAVDPDGDHVALGATNRPIGSLFIDQGNNSGTFSWTPGFGQAGTYTVTFTGRDDLGANAVPRNLVITVDDVNRGPVASAGGPYSGVVQVPITFNGTGSSDPDGTPLTYSWDFGDLATGHGATPTHSYAAGGTFTVTVTVDDGTLTDDASTIATIQDIFPARAYTLSANRTIRLGSGKASWCVEIEPVAGDFLITDVMASSVSLKYGTGQIFAESGRGSMGADKDGNGIQELTSCFSKTDLRALFAGLHKGTTTVSVTLEGNLGSGGRFRTSLTIDVVSSGGNLAASVSPNPLNPTAVLTFVTSRPGRVRVSVFDPQGHLVRMLEPGAYLQAGYHDLPVDGRGSRGERLPSGAYLYRIETAEGVTTGSFLIVR